MKTRWIKTSFSSPSENLQGFFYYLVTGYLLFVLNLFPTHLAILNFPEDTGKLFQINDNLRTPFLSGTHYNFPKCSQSARRNGVTSGKREGAGCRLDGTAFPIRFVYVNAL